ncbi:protein AGENET DOMAIN (AGD)-CONTAINING P1-like [Vicia villosa]|uniref:protein AGENET DOMAIN (AGD)-CONTAINING P1-like n=1 Tax=Vicia villosa TaxID=3911 RepID=UPI00273A8357|nr:protein AGENET DOMAIN (AGD)-CONTAINING P1-like [Vicia villosa]
MRPPMKKINYNVRDKVEVCSREEGFVGSYYNATIVSCLEKQKYVVRYKNLLLDDGSGPLTETIYSRELRPLPPRVRNPHEFHLNQKVDVFDNDGWWLGEIASEKICSDNCYYYKVYFNTTFETIYYSLDRIRVHHEWRYGEWILEA